MKKTILFAALLLLTTQSNAQQRPKNLDAVIMATTARNYCGSRFALVWHADDLRRLGLQEYDLSETLGRFGSYVKAAQEKIQTRYKQLGEDEFCRAAWDAFGPTGTLLPGAYRQMTEREKKDWCCISVDPNSKP